MMTFEEPEFYLVKKIILPLKYEIHDLIKDSTKSTLLIDQLMIDIKN